MLKRNDLRIKTSSMNFFEKKMFFLKRKKNEWRREDRSGATARGGGSKSSFFLLLSCALSLPQFEIETALRSLSRGTKPPSPHSPWRGRRRGPRRARTCGKRQRKPTCGATRRRWQMRTWLQQGRRAGRRRSRSGRGWPDVGDDVKRETGEWSELWKRATSCRKGERN